MNILTNVVRVIMAWILLIGLIMSFYIARDVIDDLRWASAVRKAKKLGVWPEDRDAKLFKNVEDFRHDFE